MSWFSSRRLGAFLWSGGLHTSLVGDSGTCPRERYSPKRWARGQTFGGAGEKGEQCAAGWIRAARSAREIARNVGSFERALEARLILLRASQKDGDLIEASPISGVMKNGAADFDRLAPFTRRGEENNEMVEFRARRGFRRKEARPQPLQTRVRRRR